MRFDFKSNDRLIDATDARLLELLYENARVSVAELARLVGMSSPSVKERLKRLEESGVIAGYRVEIDQEQAGYALTAIVRMRQLPGKLKQLEEKIISIPEFIECDKVTGEDCFYARLSLRDIRDLDRILDQFTNLAETNTAIVKSTPVKRRPLSFSRTSWEK